MSEITFPLNAWYAVAWTHEVTRALQSRTICGKKLVHFRTQAGLPVIMDDACWHRLVPLSQGRLDGDNVVCAYHGLVFEPGGRCVHMPSQETINPSASVRSYPVAERHRLLWVWPGDPARARPDSIPDLHWLEDPEWAGDGGTIHLDCDYRLVNDNLMDLTHETFVHADSIGDAAVAETPFTVSHGPGKVNVTRWMLDIDPPPFLRAQLGKPGRVDRWQIIHFTAPASISIDVGVAPVGTGAPEGDRSQGVNGQVINTCTPETERTCHYFWTFARNYKIHDQSLTSKIQSNIRRVFGQDEIILNAQQLAMEQHPDKIFYNLNIDSGGMWARRKIEDMIAEESGSRAKLQAVG